MGDFTISSMVLSWFLDAHVDENDRRYVSYDITAKGKEKGVVVVEHIITANPVFDMATMIRKINPEIAIFGARGLSADKENDDDFRRIGSVAENALKVSKVPVIIVK